MANASAGVVLSTSHAVRNVAPLPAARWDAQPPVASLLVVMLPTLPWSLRRHERVFAVADLPPGALGGQVRVLTVHAACTQLTEAARP